MDSIQEQINATTVAMNDAIRHVKVIVNQPVSQLPFSDEVRVASVHPGWFHEGAVKPHFALVDVRTTQQKLYDQYEYVTSDLNPGIMFKGSDLEFNIMTKYFYEDRNLPKKKLTETEMLEINRLYRVIGDCELRLAQLRSMPVPASVPVAQTPIPAVQPSAPPAGTEPKPLVPAKPMTAAAQTPSESYLWTMDPVSYVLWGGAALTLILVLIAYRMRRRPS